MTDSTQLVVQVPAYDEPELTRTLRQIRDQPTPEWAAVEYEAWVTPSDGATVRQAEMAEGWMVHEAPPGKLSARNAAHDHAVTSGADAVVCWDADAPPLGDDTLRTLVAPLREGAAATNSVPTSPRTLVGTLTNLAATAEELLVPHINGQAHAFTAEAWEQTGPFSESVDQTSVYDTRAEEEFRFRRRLARAGPVVDTPARVLNDTRRTECRLGLRSDGFCDRRSGSTTFGVTRRRER